MSPTLLIHMPIRILTILVALIYGHSYGADQNSLDEAQKEFCNRSSIEVDINLTVFETAWYSDALVKLLQGNTKEATNQLSSELLNKVMILYYKVLNNPCNASKEQLKRILPVIRVVASVHNTTPLPGWDENTEIMKALEYAINDDPIHYQQLVERSKDWKHGIK